MYSYMHSYNSYMLVIFAAVAGAPGDPSPPAACLRGLVYNLHMYVDVYVCIYIYI